MICEPEKKLDKKRSAEAAGYKPQSSIAVELVHTTTVTRLKSEQKYCALYDGDSSDGEDQDNKEQEYSTAKNYISSIQENITKTSYKYEYVLKDIGGRLLHNQEVSSIYFDIKQRYQIHQEKLSKLYNDINDKYIVIKHILGLKDEDAKEYFDANQSKIEDLIKARFQSELLLEEEKDFLNKVEILVPSCKGDQLTYIYDHLTYYLDDSRPNYTIVKLMKHLGIEDKADDFEKRLNSFFSKENKELLQNILSCHSKNHHRSLLIKDDASTKVKYFLDTIFEALKSEASVVQDELKKIISNLGIFAEETFSDNASNFLAKTRVYHKCIRGITKYCLIKKDFPKENTISIEIEVGTAINPDGTNVIKIKEDHQIFKSGARKVFVKVTNTRESDSYYTLVPHIQKLAEVSDLSTCFKNILRGKVPHKKDGGIFDQDQQDFLYKFTFLLFVCETTRNPSAFLTNAMFFDLVDKGIYSIGDLQEKLPVGLGGATQAGLSINQSLGPMYGKEEGYLSSVLHYDYRTEADDSNAQSLNKRDKNIFGDWVAFCKMRLDKDKIKDCIQETDAQKLENDMEVVIKSQSFFFEKGNYKVSLNNICIKRDQLFWQAEVEKAPTGILGELIEDWCGVDMSYLGEETIDFGS